MELPGVGLPTVRLPLMAVPPAVFESLQDACADIGQAGVGIVGGVVAGIDQGAGADLGDTFADAVIADGLGDVEAGGIVDADAGVRIEGDVAGTPGVEAEDVFDGAVAVEAGAVEVERLAGGFEEAAGVVGVLQLERGAGGDVGVAIAAGDEVGKQTR